jgi:hypothetical protein
LPYVSLSKAILDTFKSTLEQSPSADGKEAILAKLNQFAGLELGKAALATSLEDTMRTRFQKTEVALPSKEQLDKDLKGNASQAYAIEAFLRQQEIPGYETAYARLKTQLFNYETFVRRDVLRRVEQNFRLPREMYTTWQVSQYFIDRLVKTSNCPQSLVNQP